MTKPLSLRKSAIAIALAVASMSAAQAQTKDSSVTLYGTLDATVESASATGANVPASDVTTRTRVNSNSSFIGFRGVEDLGSGLKAKFQFETAIGVDGNASTIASPAGPSNTRLNTIGVTRDTYLGLQSESLGEFRIGYNTTPYRSLGLRMDFNPSSTGVGSNLGMTGRLGGNGNNPGFDDRLQNSVVYQSPSMSGLTVGLAYGANESKRLSGKSSNNTYGFGAGYTAGGLYLGYAYERRNDALLTTVGGLGSPTADVDGSSRGQRLGATYDFKIAKIGATYDRSSINTSTVATFSGPLGELDRNAYGVMASIPMGRGELVSEYTRAQHATLNGVGVADSSANMFSVGYNYSLSKRTTLKAVYSQINNGAGASYDFFPQGGATIGAAAGSNPRAVALGLRHSF